MHSAAALDNRRFTMRDILVHIEDYRKRPAHVVYAARLAASFDARLRALCTLSLPGELFASAKALDDVLARLRAEQEAALAQEKQFGEWTGSLGVRKCAWQVASGALTDALPCLGSWHDLLVLGHAPGDSVNRLVWMGELLLQADTPCLVVPAAYAADERPRRIALAWNGSPEAIRAIHASLPLLEKAERVVVLRGRSRWLDSRIELTPPFDIDQYLTWVGVMAEHRQMDASDQDAGAALLETTDNEAIDLLVMGAYGRTRFGEWMFGGATRHVLQHAQIPLLMRH